MPSRRRIWFLIRVTFYLVVIAVLFHYRGGVPWRRLTDRFQDGERPAAALRVSGRDLAPALIDRLLAAYVLDYPDQAIQVQGGGTNQALEDLINGRADVAFLYRHPWAAEQDLFRQADGDTAIVVPVAVGAVVVLASATDTTGALSPGLLADVLAGRAPHLPQRVYLPDPNEGLWDALRAALRLPAQMPPPGSPVVFLADPDAVLGAVTDAATASAPTSGTGDGGRVWGLVSSLAAGLDPETGPPPGVRFLAGRADPDSAAALPTYENVARGTYPLHHVLLVACRATGGRQGGLFVTHLASDRGLRQVERAGVIPARQVSREIHLTRDPLAE